MGESDRTSTATRADEDLHEAGDDAKRAAERTADKAGADATDAREAAKRAGHKLSNAVEDLIPGDSDGDGH
jgi:hypothetical protein